MPAQPISKSRRLFAGILCAVLFFFLVSIGLLIWNAFRVNRTTANKAYPYQARLAIARDETRTGAAVTEGLAREESMPAPVTAPPGKQTASARERGALQQKIIRNGFLSIRVENIETAMDQLAKLAKDANGFLAQSSIQDQGTYRTGSATLRVPSDAFDATIRQVRAKSVAVYEQTSNSQDVTDQFIDLSARLKAAQAEEAQYLFILKQAVKIQDILDVAKRLGQVRTTIEQLQGQLRYLNDRTDLATLSINMTETTSIEIPTRTWKPWETFKTALKTLVQALQGLIDIAIVALLFIIGLLLPIVVGLIILFWILKKIWRLWKKTFIKR